MAQRSEIIDGQQAYSANRGLVYTEIIGWIDLGHARGDDIRKVIAQMNQGERESKKDFYFVKYEQKSTKPMWGMSFPVFGVHTTWRIKKGRSDHDKKRIALAMSLIVSKGTEATQSLVPFSLFTNSGFSGEDLVSNLVGFYRAINGSIPLGFLKPVSLASALRRWDKHGNVGDYKNHEYRPWLFPDPATNPTGRPYKGYLPAYMREVEPWTDFRSGIVTNVTT